MEIREQENNFIFEIKSEEDVFTLTVPKNCTWQKAKGAACAFYEETIRQEYRAIVAQGTAAVEGAEKPAEETAAEVVSEDAGN